jgi:hypothetical protein
MVKWADVCAPIEHGGIGVLPLRHMNVALMLKWDWRILRDDGCLWLQLVKAKYPRGRLLLACERREGSQFWRSLQEIKLGIRAGLCLTIGDGRCTLFWLDSWLDGGPLRTAFPELFAICVDTAVLVAEVAVGR